jgi:hypothetical protein
MVALRPQAQRLAELCAVIPVACIAGAGIGEYWIGGPIYPHIAEPLGNLIDKVCREDGEESDCTKASRWQLRQAGISDEHEFKKEWVGNAYGRFDICACKDGSIRLKEVGQCGYPSPEIVTDATWK